MYFVYIIECGDKSLYTGITTDLARRLAEHKAGEGGRYTAAKGAVKVVYTEKKRNRSTASKREAEIKSWPRAKKEKLIRKSIQHRFFQVMRIVGSSNNIDTFFGFAHDRLHISSLFLLVGYCSLCF